MQPPRIDELITALEATPNIEQNTLSAVKRDTWAAMCGLTHGGYIQAEGRISATSIEVNYNEENIVLMVNRAASLTLLVLSGLPSLADDEHLAYLALDAWDTVFNKQ